MGVGLFPAPCWAPHTSLWSQPCQCQPRMAALDFPSAVKNEVLLMDFWLAFCRHLAGSWASCHSSNGTACDPDKGSFADGLSCPFHSHLGYEKCAYVFLKIIWSLIPVWKPWCMGVLRYEGVVRQRDKHSSGLSFLSLSPVKFGALWSTSLVQCPDVICICVGINISV